MGGDMLKALLALPDTSAETNRRRRLLLEKYLDEALDNGECIQCAFSDHLHYQNTTVDPSAPKMFGGYVARKMRRTSCANKCEAYFITLQAPANQPLNEDDDIRHGRSVGYLLNPSNSFMKLLTTLEEGVLEVFQSSHLHKDIIFESKCR